MVVGPVCADQCIVAVTQTIDVLAAQWSASGCGSLCPRAVAPASSLGAWHILRCVSPPWGHPGTPCAGDDGLAPRQGADPGNVPGHHASPPKADHLHVVVGVSTRLCTGKLGVCYAHVPVPCASFVGRRPSPRVRVPSHRCPWLHVVLSMGPEWRASTRRPAVHRTSSFWLSHSPRFCRRQAQPGWRPCLPHAPARSSPASAQGKAGPK